MLSGTNMNFVRSGEVKLSSLILVLILYAFVLCVIPAES